MRVGTKSVLFGVHQFLIHPWFVARGWFHLYGMRRVAIGGNVFASLWHPLLWVAFFVHDVGYLGKPNMDGEEGEQHPIVGARILDRLGGVVWGRFALYHSRYFAKQRGAPPSALCFADKLAFVYTPRWLYLLCANASGEIREYMAKSNHMNETGGKYAGQNISLDDQRAWHRDVCDYVTRWVAEHKDGRDDTWTKPKTNANTTRTGVWS